MLEFTQPLAFLALLLPALVYLLAPPHRQAMDSLQVPYFQRLVELSGAHPGRGSSVVRRRRIQGVFGAVGWLLLTTALAAPQWVGSPITIEKSARDLMLALDLSGSMETADFSDSGSVAIARIDAAKKVLSSFGARRQGDRLGLIVFGNAAYLQAPFTDDIATWQTLLAESEVGMAGQSTALGDAIGLAIAMFEESQTQNRVLIVLTDGNDTGSRVPPRDAAVIAAEKGVTIYTVAVGDPQAVGEEALDLDTLRAVASRSGGDSFEALDKQALEAAYTRIDTLEPARFDSLSYRPRESLFHLPLAGFAVLYLTGLPVFIILGRQQAVRGQAADA